MKKIIHVVGARPNFMKTAPVIAGINEYNQTTESRNKFQIQQLLVHTGQHYDKNMSAIFFKQLGMPDPDINLGVGSGSHAKQTAEIMLSFEKILIDHKPDIILVYGDVNSTIAAALVASKMGIRIGHVEAGLRSWDRTMPEEINRVLTDQITDYFFTPSSDGDQNLKREGIPQEKIFMVGNVMIDTLVRLLSQIKKPDISFDFQNKFVLVTLHRPSNVDDSNMINKIISAIKEISKNVQIIFPIHPRTRQRLLELKIELLDPNIKFTEPLGYLEFLWLQKNASLVITDSGGIQEETTYLNIPCLTLRENTERPITVEMGTNILIGRDMDRMKQEILNILNGKFKKTKLPPLWDGHAGERIVEILVSMLNEQKCGQKLHTQKLNEPYIKGELA